jgi:hypothetical protein
MASFLSTGPARVAASDKAARGFTFSPQTPSEFANIILGQARISDLKTLQRVLLGDPGKPLEMRRNKSGSSYEAVDIASMREAAARNGWYVLERGPGFLIEEAPRMRVFKTFEGAAAEFVTRIRTHDEGSLTVGKVPAGPLAEATRFTFEGKGRSMVMAPVATPLTGLLL